MQNIDTKISPAEMQKSAIIYRDASARFIYVCYHCGSIFNEINATLQHIDSHFQVVSVIVDQITEDGKEVKVEDIFAETSDNIKIEPLDDDDDIVSSLAAKPAPMNENGKRKATRTDSKVLKKCSVQRKTKKIVFVGKASTARKSNHKAASQRNYRCHKCSVVRKTASALQVHIKRHPVDELLLVFKCTKCDDYFKTASALRVHVLAMHLKKRKFKCDDCSVEFAMTQSKRFLEHLQLHSESDNKQWTGAIHHHNSDYTKYEEIDSFTEERFPCDICPQRFYIKSNLDTHMKSIHSGQQRQLKCFECYAIFTAPKFYYAHQLEHKRVGADITERDQNVLLANVTALVDERILHSDGDEFSQQPFRCAICDFTSMVHHDIRSHIRRMHVYKMFPLPVESPKQFICDFCGMSLKSKGAIIKHLQIHANIKPYACKFCGKMFRLGSTRTIHERQHTGEKPYQCHKCGRAFISKGLLTAHKRTHEDTTYPCHICGKAFNLPSGYRSHIKTHREDRDFKCTVCAKTFNTRLYLGRHMEIHSDRKHPCRYCGSEFNTGDGLRQHYRHQHKNEWKLCKQK